MTAIANGYFEGIEKHDNRFVISAADCDRFENGVQMTNRSGATTPRACATAVDRLTHIKAVPDRHYDLVDEERGVVLSMVRHPGGRGRHASSGGADAAARGVVQVCRR